MADYYCKCKTCKYIDPNERRGYKWYCEYYRTYEDPDIVRECKRYEKASEQGSGCFLTEACCGAKGLADDCYELTTLRTFRDDVLLKDAEGSHLVKRYYEIAPSIVALINQRADKLDIYDEIFGYVKKMLSLIEDEESQKAIMVYSEMIIEVQTKLLNK